MTAADRLAEAVRRVDQAYWNGELFDINLRDPLMAEMRVALAAYDAERAGKPVCGACGGSGVRLDHWTGMASNPPPCPSCTPAPVVTGDSSAPCITCGAMEKCRCKRTPAPTCDHEYRAWREGVLVCSRCRNAIELAHVGTETPAPTCPTCHGKGRCLYPSGTMERCPDCKGDAK